MLAPKQIGIYAIVHVESGRTYIGSSVNIAARWREHKLLLRKGRHRNPPLQHTWNKYGEAAFMFHIIECVDDVTMLIAREQFHADRCANVFNVGAIVASPQLGRAASAETRARISAIHKGRPKSAEHRAKIGAAHKGRKWTPEQLAHSRALRASRPKQKQSPEWIAMIKALHTGKPKSAEHRAKIAAANMGHPGFNKGAPRPEIVAKLSESMRQSWASGKRRASHKGWKLSPETRDKMRIAQIDRRQREAQHASV